MDELKCILRSIPTTIHVILLTETWIATEEEAKIFTLDNYTHYFNIRNNKRGGGVSTFVHDSLNHTPLHAAYVGGNNYLWVHLERFSLDVGLVYNPGDTNFSEFLDNFGQQLQEHKRSLVFGDFNIDLLNKVDNKTRHYKALLKESGYLILNRILKQFCTRETATTRSLIDHVLTNLPEANVHLATVDSSLSDHKQIYVEIKKTRPPKLKKTQYNATDYKKLYNYMQEEQLEFTNYNDLEEYILSSINKSKEVKTKIENLPKKDWINKEIINLINQKNKLWNELKIEQDNLQKREEYYNLRNKVRQIIKKTKETFYLNKFDGLKGNPKKLWSLINTLSINKAKISRAPPVLKLSTGEVSDPKQICEVFNDFFSSIGSKLANEILPKYHLTSVFSMPSFNHNSKLDKFTPCTKDEVVKIIADLNVHSSSGIDEVTTKQIKCIGGLMANNFSNCFNKLLSEGYFPASLKLAKVSPIHKSGSTSDPNNYRPISVLPVMSKVLERLLFTRLDDYLSSSGFFSEFQYGFRPNSNTLAATLDLITDIKTNIDNKKIALGVFIDLKKAFDTVSHNLLLKKLEKLGISGSALIMLKSYLSDRYQITRIHDNQSSAKPITCGVPQGSILGPLLFLIYINNITETKVHGRLTLYADDTCLFYFGNSLDEIINKAQEDLNTIYNWFQYNLLTINASKTCYCIFKPKNKKIINNFELYINGEPISEKKEEKYLGLRIDNHLMWTSQIDYVRAKLTSFLGIIRHNVNCFPRKVRYILYNSFVKSHLIYLVELWGTASNSKLKCLQILQNKIIKCLFNFHNRTNTDKIYKETKLMNISQLYRFQTLILIYKILHKKIHSKIKLNINHATPKYSQRRPKKFFLVSGSRTNYGRKVLTSEGALLFNKLPDFIKKSESLNIFKQRLKDHILEDVLTLRPI